jgi:hypothetical protein
MISDKANISKPTPSTSCNNPSQVIVLHVTIIASGFLVTILDSPIVGLLLLVGLKIGLDLHSHVREHTGEVLPIPRQSD